MWHVVRLKRSFDVDAADLAPLVTQIVGAVPVVLAGLRRLEFADGAAVHPDTGERREGLRDMTGTHPRPGSRYSVVLADESLRPDGPWAAEMAAVDDRPLEERFDLRGELFERHRDRAAAEGLLDVTLHEAEVELLHDDAGQFAVRVVNVGNAPFAADVRLTRPARPDELTVDVVVPVTERFVAGDIEVHAVVDVGSIPGGIVSRPQIRVDARHRRGRLGVVAKITDRPGGRWNVDVSVSARGRGWIRPFAAVVLHIGRRKVRDHLDDSLDDSIDDFESGLSEVLATDPLPIADDIVAEIVGGCVQHLDQARRLAAVQPPVPSITVRIRPISRSRRWLMGYRTPWVRVDGLLVAAKSGADTVVEIAGKGATVEVRQTRAGAFSSHKSTEVAVQSGDLVRIQNTGLRDAPHVTVSRLAPVDD